VFLVNYRTTAHFYLQCHRVKADLVAARFLMRLTLALFISTNKRNHWAGRTLAESVSKTDEKLSSRLKCRQFTLNPTKKLVNANKQTFDKPYSQ